jgi:cephalosporin hydroxylase
VKIILDTDTQELSVSDGERSESMDLHSKAAFEVLSHQWVRLGWQMKYPYSFSWLGRPIIQLPEDMIRMQEVIYRIRPDVIIETGVAHGGSLVFYAGLCKVMGKGRIIGLDIEVRPHNRAAIESHELFDFITLIEGDSVGHSVINTVHAQIAPTDVVLVILDSNHSRAHVLAELEAYADLVTPESYIVATDGVMAWVHDVPRGTPSWEHDNPTNAARDFLDAHPEFILEQPPWPFNESPLDENVTHWPGAWLKRLSGT